MDELPPNSHKSKDPNQKSTKAQKKEKKLTKVVDGEAEVKKPSILTRIKNTFLGADARSVAGYLGMEVLLPALRNLIVDTATKGVERAIYGDTTPRSRRSGAPGEPRFRYDTPMRSPAIDPRRERHRPSARPRAHDLGDILVASKTDADRVIEVLTDTIDQYGVASVADLYELLGLGSVHTDNVWGWTSLPYARAVQTRDGYLIDLPPIEQIDV